MIKDTITRYKMNDPNYLYRYILDGQVNIKLMPNKDKIGLTKNDIRALIDELEKWEKENARDSEKSYT